MSGVVLTAGWERPQLTLRIGSADGPLRADAFRLARTDRPTQTMPPTGWRRDGDVLELRFNVTVGPGIRALAPGRWRFLEGDQPLAVDEAVDLAAAARSFVIPQGTYRITPVRDPSDGGLLLDVSLELAATRRRPGLRGRLGRTRRRILDGPSWTRIIFRPMRAIRRRNGRRIAFVSGSRRALARNLKLVYDRMVERGLDRDLELRPVLRRRSGKDIPWRDRVGILWALAGADVILVEGSRQTLIYMVDLAPDVRFIQLWHASGAFKTVRYSQLGKANGPDPWSRTHRNYTHAIVSSEADIPFYAEGFGIPEDRVIPTGIPRLDRFFDDRGQAIGRAAAYAAYPEAEGRMTILFAPTYRDADHHGTVSIRSRCSTMRRSTRSPSRRTRWSSSGCTRSHGPTSASRNRSAIVCSTGSVRRST